MSLFFRGAEIQVLDSNGDPVSGALVNFYETDGVTRKDTFNNEAHGSTNANPVVCDGEGRASIVLDGTYKFNVTTSGGATIEPTTTITSSNQLAQQWIFKKTAVQVSTTSFKVVGEDVTSTYSVGRRVKLTDSSTLYGEITDSSFSSDTTVTVSIDGATALTGSLTTALVSIGEPLQVNSTSRKFKFLTGNTDNGDLVYAVKNSIFIPTINDVILAERTSSSGNLEPQYWECTSLTATLPAGASEGDITGDADGDLYILNNGSDYFKFVHPASSTSGEGQNLIIGGDFGTNPFSEGTTITGITNGSFIARFWEYNEVGTAVHDAKKTADAPTFAEAGMYADDCLHIDCTTADVSLGVGDYVFLAYTIEGRFFRRIAQHKFFIAFWHKHTKTGTYCVAFQNSGADRSYVVEYNQIVTDTWELTFAVVTESPSAGTWDYDSGTGLKVIWTLAAGSTFHASAADTWETGDFIATSNQVNAADSASNDFKIALCQIGLGTSNTEFEILTIDVAADDTFGTLPTTTVVSNDKVVVQDTSDSNLTKTATAQAVADLSALVFIAKFSPSGATNVDITGITSAFDEYEIHLLNVIPSDDAVAMHMKTSSDGGSNFDVGGSDYSYGVLYIVTTVPTSLSADNTQSFLATTNIGNATNEMGISGVLRLVRPSESTYTKFSFVGDYTNISTVPTPVVSSGQRNSAGVVNAIRFVFSSGTQTGEYALYGVRRV